MMKISNAVKFVKMWITDSFVLESAVVVTAALMPQPGCVIVV